MSHIGVLRVLEEEKIPIDEIVGVSVGALIGSLYAAGLPILFGKVPPGCRQIFSATRSKQALRFLCPRWAWPKCSRAKHDAGS